MILIRTFKLGNSIIKEVTISSSYEVIMNLNQYLPYVLIAVIFAIVFCFLMYRVAVKGDRKAFRKGYAAALFVRGEMLNDDDKAKMWEIYEKPSFVGCILHANAWESGYKGALAVRGWKPEEHDFAQLSANPYKSRDAALIVTSSFNNK